MNDRTAPPAPTPPSRCPEDDALEPADVRAILEHMNDDHADAVAVCARAFADGPARRLLERDSNAVIRLVGIDRRGIDLLCTSASPAPARERIVRIDFPEPLVRAADARRALVKLTRSARAALGS